MDKQDRKNLAKAMSMMSQMAVTALACVAICVLIGYWLDRWLGTEPIILVVMSLFGVASAILAMVGYAKKFE